MEDGLHAALATSMLTLLSTTLMPAADALALGITTAIVANALIDGIGTEKENDNYYTTPATHTLPRAAFLGAAAGAAGALLAILLTHSAPWPVILLAISGGTLTGLLHLALDTLTGDAIYVKRNGEWKKIILVKRKIQNLRGAIILASLVMLMLAFKIISL